MIEASQSAVFASYLIRFRPYHQSYARFLQYWLRSDAYWELVRARSAGTTRVSLNANILRGFPLVVPTNPALDAFRQTVHSLRARVIANVEESCAIADHRDTLLTLLMRVGQIAKH